MRPRLIVLEGIDGSGKSAVASRLSAALARAGIDVWATREPTDGPAGRAVQEAIKDPDHDPLTEALLFAADHLDHLRSVREALAGGRWVISDRYSHSFRAYQSVTLRDAWPRDAAVRVQDWLDAVLAPHELAADLVLLLDVDPDRAVERVGGRPGRAAKFERAAFLSEVRAAYLALAERHGFTVIDSNGRLDDAVDACLAAVRTLEPEADL